MQPKELDVVLLQDGREVTVLEILSVLLLCVNQEPLSRILRELWEMQ